MFKVPYTQLLSNVVKRIEPSGDLGTHYIVKYESWGYFSTDRTKPLVHEGKGVYRSLRNDTRIIWGDKVLVILLQENQKIRLFEDGSYKLIK